MVGLVLTPHASTLGSGEYFERAEACVAGGATFVAIPAWYAHPDFVALMAQRVTAAFAQSARRRRDRYRLIFTAHSLPERVRELGDPYPDQLEDSAKLVAAAAGIERYEVCWQSAGRTPEPWLGPDIRDVVRDLGRSGDTDGVVICPVGFVSDHLEVLFDLDIELAAVAEAAGITYVRTASLNDDPPSCASWPTSSPRPRPKRTEEAAVSHVVVIGGGISGLAAAWELSGGADGPVPDTPEITVLEASSRLGGPLFSQEFAGRVIDLGPDGFLGRRPEALDLCTEIGIDDHLVPIGGRGAGVYARGRIRPLPASLALGIPDPILAGGPIGHLGPAWAGRTGPRRPVPPSGPPRANRRPLHWTAGGPQARTTSGRHAGRPADWRDPRRIGRQHVDCGHLPTAARCGPVPGSLMRALRGVVPPPSEDAPPLFWALDGGMSSLIDHLARRLSERGVTIECDHAVRALERGGRGWSVHAAAATTTADAVIVAVPAHAAGKLLAPHDEEVARLLGAIDYASVALVTFAAANDSVPGPLVGTGFLVPRRSPKRGGEPWAVTACTYLCEKWPKTARPGGNCCAHRWGASATSDGRSGATTRSSNAPGVNSPN